MLTRDDSLRFPVRCIEARSAIFEMNILGVQCWSYLHQEDR
jgi:hypothetical protein